MRRSGDAHWPEVDISEAATSANTREVDRNDRGTPGPEQELEQHTLLRILTHNVGQHLASFDALDQLMILADADLVCLQEIPLAYTEQRFPHLAARYPYQGHTCREITNGIGMALLSRWPIEVCDTMRLAPEGLVLQQRAVLRPEGSHPLVVYNIHLTFPWIRLRSLPVWPRVMVPWYDHHVRSDEVAQLDQHLAREPWPVLLAGDFNLSRYSLDYHRLTQRVRDAMRMADTTHRTWPAHQTPSGVLPLPVIVPCVGLDYVFVSPAWCVRKARIMSRTGSDHLPVLAEVVMAGAGKGVYLPGQ